MLKDCKIDAFQKPVSSLADAPELSAQELKARFDASPEECRKSINGVVDTLSGVQGAYNIGFRESEGVHAKTVQEAIENVQGQLQNVTAGMVPEGSVSQKMLASDVIQRFEAGEGVAAALEEKIENAKQALDAETQARQKADESLTNTVNSVRSTANAAMSGVNGYIATGTYRGTGGEVKVAVGFEPKAVFITPELSSAYPDCYGVLINTSGIRPFTKTGFSAFQSPDHHLSQPGVNYYYVALK